MLKNWKKRKLTFIGKIVVINTLVISKITYLANTQVISAQQLKDMERLLYSFLWDGSEKVKRNIMIQNYDNGGH